MKVKRRKQDEILFTKHIIDKKFDLSSMVWYCFNMELPLEQGG